MTSRVLLSLVLVTSVAAIGCRSATCPTGTEMTSEGTCTSLDGSTDAGSDSGADGGADSGTDAGSCPNVGQFCGTNMSVEGECRRGIIACINGTEQCQGEQGPIPEVCGDGKDNDCMNGVDDGCACTPDDTQTCGSTDVGLCTFGMQTCQANGSWGACDAVMSTMEICDGDDNDCDGNDDNGFDCVQTTTFSCTTSCGSTGSGSCNGTCAATCTPPSEICNYADDDCDGSTDEGVAAFGNPVAIDLSITRVDALPLEDTYLIGTPEALLFVNGNGTQSGQPTTVNLDMRELKLAKLADERVVAIGVLDANSGLFVPDPIYVTEVNVSGSSPQLGTWKRVPNFETTVAVEGIGLANGDLVLRNTNEVVRLDDNLDVAVAPKDTSVDWFIALSVGPTAGAPLITATGSPGSSEVTILRIDPVTLAETASVILPNSGYPALYHVSETGDVAMLTQSDTGTLDHHLFDVNTLKCPNGSAIETCGTTIETGLNLVAERPRLIRAAGRWIAAWSDGTQANAKVLGDLFQEVDTFAVATPSIYLELAGQENGAALLTFVDSTGKLATVPFGCF